MRPLPAPPPTTDAGEPALVELLRTEIEAHGPITFARFMGRALYEPGVGYYAVTHDRPTRSGDFLTAPEIHPIFGRAIAAQVGQMFESMNEPADFTVREYGAGRGTLGSALGDRFRYQPVEATDQRPTQPMVGVIVANEFIDALPVQRIVMQDGRLRELFVGLHAGRFVDVEGDLSDERLDPWFAGRGIELAEGQRAEANLAMLDWLAEVSATLERGYVLIVDYGLPAAELYSSARPGGTLRAFRSHHVGSDVLSAVGHQDLTAHIDLGALETGARSTGLEVVGRTTQMEFLVGCGLEELLEDERARAGEDWQAQLLLRSSVGRLLDPRQMGNYAVVVLGRGVDPALPVRGLSYRLPRA